jgi:2-polyprenyl-3-methyl-5-hydroxy-6-metoxy-1,4-benzoquinol methylase
MKYDPIKQSLGSHFNRTPGWRKLFYRLLDILLLRTWHVKKSIRKYAATAPANVSALDAGSGFGQYAYYMARKNPEWIIQAVDIKTEQVEDCKSFFKKAGYNKVSFEYADLTKFVRGNSYDLILSIDVMEHIEEDVQVFKNLYRSLRKNGLLIISTPSDQGGSDVHEHHKVENYQNDGTASFVDEHVRDGYNVEEIKSKLKQAGFSEVFVKYTYGAPGKISWKLSMKYPILMLNKSKIFFALLPFYYLLTYWFALLMNYFDLYGSHKTGTGLLVEARK